MQTKSKISKWIGVIAGIIIIFSPMLGAKWGIIVSVLTLAAYIMYMYKYERECLKIEKNRMIASWVIAFLVAIVVVIGIRVFLR